MAITIGTTAIKGLYLGSSTIKAASMGADSNKIYPAEILYADTGEGSYYNTFTIPAGYNTLEYTIEISSGDATTIQLYDNSSYFIDETTMSGNYSDTVTVTQGTLTLDINTMDTGTTWNFELKLT